MSQITATQPVLVNTTQREKSKHLSSLDGLRATSILLVILGHLGGTQGFFGRINLGIGDYAHLGVIIFFVISGFLITSLLLAEHGKRGSLRCVRTSCPRCRMGDSAGNALLCRRRLSTRR